MKTMLWPLFDWVCFSRLGSRAGERLGGCSHSGQNIGLPAGSGLARLAVFSAMLLFTVQALAVPGYPKVAPVKEDVHTRIGDLLQLTKHSAPADTDAAMQVLKVSFRCYDLVEHLADLVMVYDTLDDSSEGGKKGAPGLLIVSMLERVSKDIDSRIEEINMEAVNLKSAAIVSVADQLKGDMRRLKKIMSGQ